MLLPFPTFKPLYFEKLSHWPTLKILDFSWNVVRKIYRFCLAREISCLTAWRVLESLGWPKKCKNFKIWQNNMTLRTDKDLKSKKFIWKKVYILAKHIDSKSQKRQFEIKAKKNWAWKRPIFLGHPYSGSCVQNAKTLLQNIFLFTILVPWKNQPLPITSSRDKCGGAIMPPPSPSLSFVKYPRPLRVSSLNHRDLIKFVEKSFITAMVMEID